ncbi:SPP1 phage holin family protein [Mammaliicoccus sciuri]|uniref:phage holin n=1 Tax=Mammaliicoccus sciuri TaxID=1296 RepID=UPI001D0D6EA6|nr:phage holin [Mammaliicoccus sciuri]MCC2087875.1 SPP1 phage holin family protein [Mammaliicoccus sciuri]
MDSDKIKQYIAMLGGFLGALYLALNASGISAEWINPEKVDLWLNVLNAGLPFVLVAYGVYKNTYIVTKKAKEQEKTLKENDMK